MKSLLTIALLSTNAFAGALKCEFSLKEFSETIYFEFGEKEISMAEEVYADINQMKYSGFIYGEKPMDIEIKLTTYQKEGMPNYHEIYTTVHEVGEFMPEHTMRLGGSAEIRMPESNYSIKTPLYFSAPDHSISCKEL